MSAPQGGAPESGSDKGHKSSIRGPCPSSRPLRPGSSAESEGFKPPVRQAVQRISSPPRSVTLATLLCKSRSKDSTVFRSRQAFPPFSGHPPAARRPGRPQEQAEGDRAARPDRGAGASPASRPRRPHGTRKGTRFPARSPSPVPRGPPDTDGTTLYKYCAASRERPRRARLAARRASVPPGAGTSGREARRNPPRASACSRLGTVRFPTSRASPTYVPCR